MVNALPLGVAKQVVHPKKESSPLKMVTTTTKEIVTPVTPSQRRGKRPTTGKNSSLITQKSHLYLPVMKKVEESAGRSPEPLYSIAWEKNELRKIYGRYSQTNAKLKVVEVRSP